MEQPVLSAGMMRCGVFEIDLKTFELRKHGMRLKLAEQPFQILAILLEKPGQLVTRDQIRARLWPEDTFVDFDHGLNNAMMRVREALGDSSENPRFIETLPRRGYRFIAPVEQIHIPELEAPSRAARSDNQSDLQPPPSVNADAASGKIRALASKRFSTWSTIPRIAALS